MENQQPTVPAPKKLERDTANAWVAGVCAGLAKHFDMDVTLIRVLFVIAGLFTRGIAIIAYIVMAFMVPAAPLDGKPNAERRWIMFIVFLFPVFMAIFMALYAIFLFIFSQIN